ncbi:restriction endonuclease-related protein [Streptomyces sp. NPDC004778]
MTTTAGDESPTFSHFDAFRLINFTFIKACEALTAPELGPNQRTERLMRYYGDLLAAYGPDVHLPFGEFRRKLRGTVDGLLPDWLDRSAFDNLDFTVVDADGCVTGSAFDLQWETTQLHRILRRLKRNGRTRFTDEQLQDEIDQDQMYELLKGRGDEQYVRDRTTLVECPAGDRKTLSTRGLPLNALRYYEPIPYHSTYRTWWFPCTVCQWPMRISKRVSGGDEYYRVTCLYGRHADTGASFVFRPTLGSAPELHPDSTFEPLPREAALFLHGSSTVPEAQPVEDSLALRRGVWRYTCVPGLHELRLHQELSKRLGALAERRRAHITLWPMQDAYDHRIEVTGAGGDTHVFTVDVKDYTHARVLAESLDRNEGDKGGARWLVVPDHRADQIPLLSVTCNKYAMKAATMTDFAETVCRTAGVAWA